MKTHPEYQYLSILESVLSAKDRIDRTGTGTRSKFGFLSKYPLSEGFPLITTKKLHTRSIIHELIWFLKGEGNIKYLQDNKVSIWDEWADENGNLGPVYGVQWRNWKTYHSLGGSELGEIYSEGKPIDQIKNLIDSIQRDPYSRRHIVSAWNPAQIGQMALPPCHVLFQFYVEEDDQLSCMLYQRSGDLFLGVPFNIASYALLTHMVAHVCGLKPGTFNHVLGDAHIYLNHLNQVETQLKREPLPFPRLKLSPSVKSIDGFTYDDIKIEGYDSHPAIKGDISV